MNIVGFTIGILMIFAIMTNTLIVKKNIDNDISNSYLGFYKANRDVVNKYQSDIYNKIEARPNPRTKQDQIPNDTREINIANAKINIFPFIRDGKKTHLELYNLTASLIKTLYIKQSFYREGVEITLLDNIIKASKEFLDTDIYLEKLNFNNKNLQMTFYKILKGSKYYNFEKDVGYASLLDFVMVEKTNSKILIKDASNELLTSLFQKDQVAKIQKLQLQNPPKNLTQSNLLTFCDSKKLDLFDFSKRAPNKKENIIVGIDPKTNIKMTKRTHL